MELTVITSNVSADFLTPPGVPIWEERRALYVRAVREALPDLIGLQEVTPRQLRFFQEQLPEFVAVTVPVIDPDPELQATWHTKYARYGLPVVPDPYELVLFYRADFFEVVDSGYWWLSPMPERPSIGFGNVAPRAVLWAHLQYRHNGRDLIIFNTHIDHRSPRPMVELCRERLANFMGRAPSLVFMGDLNFDPDDANFALLMQDGWRDAHEVVAAPESATFLYDLPDIPGGRIDHILYRGEGLTPQRWVRLASPDPARRISDHDPVCVQFLVD
ncbi:MAG TPA: endonuclease/exonuclease/phosphatase family protein [Chloroflexota bacterium]|nr:endonuclease/exonuclease/phosphatase family protein [Chloroflexota bacterium]